MILESLMLELWCGVVERTCEKVGGVGDIDLRDIHHGVLIFIEIIEEIFGGPNDLSLLG